MSQGCGPHLHLAWSSHSVVSCAISCGSDVFALEPGGRVAEVTRCVPWQALSTSSLLKAMLSYFISTAVSLVQLASILFMTVWHFSWLSDRKITHWSLPCFPADHIYVVTPTFFPPLPCFFGCFVVCLFFVPRGRHKRRGGSTLDEQISLPTLRGNSQPG